MSPVMAASHMLNVHEAADRLGVSVSYLNKLRLSGNGPTYLKLGARRVVYDPGDLAQWVDASRRQATAKTAIGGVRVANDAAPAAIMDWEPAIAAVTKCMAAGQDILNLLPEPQERCGPALEGIGQDLAEALHAVLSWIPTPDVETRELVAALEGYLP